MSSKIIINTAKTFRQNYQLTKLNANWFPPHMTRGLLQMQAKLRIVDCIIEVHDARIPFSGRNPNFYRKLTAIRPHILVLNKKDLVDVKYQKNVEKKLLEKYNDMNIVFSNCRERLGETSIGVKEIIPMAVDLIKASNRFGRSENLQYNIMIIGIPNVGKSSIINSLRALYTNKGSGAPVGALPGVTKHVMEKIKISHDPLVYLLDTPGVLQPNIKDVDAAMRLALCASTNEYLIGRTLIADYLLYWFNKNNCFDYVHFLNLNEATDDINEVLMHICIEFHMINEIRSPEGGMKKAPNFEAAADYFIRSFRKGKMGQYLLDVDKLDINK